MDIDNVCLYLVKKTKRRQCRIVDSGRRILAADDCKR